MNTSIKRVSTLAATCLVLLACDENSQPTAVSREARSDAGTHTMHSSATVLAADLTPFTFRASLEPYRIHQLPDFLMHSTARKDIVIQRSVFNPGAGPWHTHPGPSFIYVIEGEIKLERHNAHQGCFETPVYHAGEAYSEVADEVHRAVVMSATPAVVLVTRFNIPVGAPITVPAANPGC
jgi:quercetin dioxygenase-like cupin family protein